MGNRDAVAVMRALAGAVGLTAGGIWLLVAYVALSSRINSDLSTDPHGYGMLFGTVLSIPIGLVCAVALPFLFPRSRWSIAFPVAAAAYLAGSAVLVTALLTA